MTSRNGTRDPDTGRPRVYGGDPDLVHIQDGQRCSVGAGLASHYDATIRTLAIARKANASGALCPGCYMVAVYNCAVTLATRNGQSLSELGETMAAQFSLLALHPEIGLIEEIEVLGGKGNE